MALLPLAALAASLSLAAEVAPAAPAAEAPKPEAAAEAPKTAEEAPAKPETPDTKSDTKKGAPSDADEKAQKKPRGSAKDELDFLKEKAKADSDTQKAAAIDLELFADSHAGTELAPEALAALAALQQKLNDSTCLVTWLRLVYEFPQTPQGRDARAAFTKAAEERLPKRLKDAAASAARGSEAQDAAARLAEMIETLSGPLGDSLYGPALAQTSRFERRFPDFAGGDRVALATGKLRERVQDWPAALMAYDRLLALYPSSPLRAQALWARGVLLAERVRDYRGASAAFTELADNHQDAAEAPLALERAGQLLSDKLKMYEPAVEAYRKLVGRYAGTEAARRALESEAKLERSKLGNPQQAVKTLETLADQFASHPVAPEALYEAGQIYEDDLKDLSKAVAEYKQVAAKFPAHKLGKKAADRAAKLGAEAK
jgi:outer membrane protein assembly factor BamD (BamD/ComL family)